MAKPQEEQTGPSQAGPTWTVPGKGSNSLQLRHYNERVVLDAIRRMGEASKADVARHARLTPPAVSDILGALVDAGYVESRGQRRGGKGQPSALYGLNPQGGYSIGIHIGRRSLDGVLMGFAGDVIAYESLDHDFPEPRAVAAAGDQIVQGFRDRLGPEARRLVGVGISAPYFLGSWESELGFPREVSEAWRDVDLDLLLDTTAGLPVFVENDASAAAAAELVFGAGQRLRDFVHLTVGTMIGGGLILDGVLQTGPNGNAAAYGPMPVTPSRLSSVPRPAGPFEVLLRRASIYGLLNHLRAADVHLRRARELEPMPEAAARPFAEWREDCADALAQAIVATVSVVDVEAVVIDGLLPEALMKELVTAVDVRFRDVVPQGVLAPAILLGAVGPRASAMGAAILPIYLQFAPDSSVLTRRAVEKKPLMIRQVG